MPAKKRVSKQGKEYDVIEEIQSVESEDGSDIKNREGEVNSYNELELNPVLKFFAKIADFIDWLSFNIPPNSLRVTVSTPINIQKGGLPFFLFTMMLYYWNFSRGAWIYFVLHGSYGCFWMLKHFTFPDARFNQTMSLSSALVLWILILGPYMLPGYYMMSKQAEQQPGWELCAFSLLVYFIGVVLMLGADA